MAAERSAKSEFFKNISNYATMHKSQFIHLDDEPKEMQCLLCDEKYELPTNEQNFLTHLFMSHRLVIGDVWKIASLKSYIHYWRTRLQGESLVKFCTTMLMDCTPDGKESKNEPYFLLSDCLSEDKTLRDELHRAKLEWILAIQAQERSDVSFKRGCMFCRTEFSGSRSAYLKHLSEKHNIQLGKPENLVFIDKYLDKIEENIEKLICIYCEKSFKSRTVLREHMRKKMHKRVNPNNKFYDKFYIINYLDLDRNSKHKHRNEAIEIEDDDGYENDDEDIIFNDEQDESEWSDWNDDTITITCLFCKYSNKEFNGILQHMIEEHNFNLEMVIQKMDFYEKIKVVNYIRFQIHSTRCVYCNTKHDDVIEHMKRENHYKLPESKAWNQPEFYFPLFDDDPFLYNLDANSTDAYENEIDCDNFNQSLDISKNE